MSLLARLGITLAIFVIAWLVIWLVAEILLVIPTEPTAWFGALLHRIEVAVAILVALAYLVFGANWTLRR